jgi:LysR family transcriptional regulator, regulator for bpeEF and oprC
MASQPNTTDNLLAVRTLVHVVETRSLTEAARRLELTPSAVSKQISRLEESLGVRLLERTTRQVRPTDAGLELAQRTSPLFDGFAEATTAAREHRHDICGRVRISTSPALGRTRILPVLAALAKEHRALDFDIVLTGKKLDFFEDELDLVVREGPLEDSSLVARRLGASRVMLCASPAYVKRHGRPRAVEDLGKHELLLVPAADVLRHLPALRAQLRSGERVEPRFRINDLFALKDLAESGAGIAALPDYVAASCIHAGTLVHLLPRTKIADISIHALYPSRRHLPRRVSIVLDALAAAF